MWLEGIQNLILFRIDHGSVYNSKTKIFTVGFTSALLTAFENKQLKFASTLISPYGHMSLL